MCELLGMSARYPTDLDRSLDLFRPRGGEIGPHADGWGLAFFEGRAARLFKEPIPACRSRCLEFLQGYGLTSRMVLAHIRKANPTTVERVYANTHPFERELGGRAWIFAHNGVLPGVENIPLGRYRPMGDTDSEWAFCLVMEAVFNCSIASGDIEDVDRMLNCLRPVVDRINLLDEFNFLIGNGEHMLVHAHSELSLLERSCRVDGCDQRVVLVATQPLSDEPWQRLAPNTLLVLKDGEIIRNVTTNGQVSPHVWKRRRGQPGDQAQDGPQNERDSRQQVPQ